MFSFLLFRSGTACQPTSHLTRTTFLPQHWEITPSVGPTGSAALYMHVMRLNMQQEENMAAFYFQSMRKEMCKCTVY